MLLCFYYCFIICSFVQINTLFFYVQIPFEVFKPKRPFYRGSNCSNGETHKSGVHEIVEESRSVSWVFFLHVRFCSFFTKKYTFALCLEMCKVYVLYDKFFAKIPHTKQTLPKMTILGYQQSPFRLLF